MLIRTNNEGRETALATIERNALTLERVEQMIPCVATTHGMPTKVSSRYVPFNSLQIAKVMMDEGWVPVQANAQLARAEQRIGYQKHLIRFSHPDLTIGRDQLQACFTNAHNWRSSYVFNFGIWRFTCANGLMVGETFESIRIPHLNITQDAVIAASRNLLEFAPKIAEQVENLKGIELTLNEKGVYAQSAMTMIYGEDGEENKWPFSPERLLQIRRSDDRQDNLWTVYNTVQENIIKGGIRYQDPETYRHHKTRPVKAIDKSIKLNKALHTLTVRMAELHG